MMCTGMSRFIRARDGGPTARAKSKRMRQQCAPAQTRLHSARRLRRKKAWGHRVLENLPGHAAVEAGPRAPEVLRQAPRLPPAAPAAWGGAEAAEQRDA
eukprot:5269286-Pyramimonas_sp.AAC.1